MKMALKIKFLMLVTWTSIVIILQPSKIYGCRISEFYCDNGECVGLDKYCDGRKDCQDGSDEAPFCSRKCRLLVSIFLSSLEI